MSKILSILSLIILLSNMGVAEAFSETINCNRSKMPKEEQLICQTKELKRMDNILDMYLSELKYRPEYVDFQQEHKEWKVKRSACRQEATEDKQKECIYKIYETMLKEAEEIMLFYHPEYKKLREECQSLNLSDDCEVYVYDTPGLNVDFADFQIDPNMETHLQTIKVNRPNKCVNLILTTFEPTVWRIKYTPATKVKNVILGKTRDNHSQMVQGVEVGTKVYRNLCSLQHEREYPFTGIKNIQKINNPIIGAEEPEAAYWYHPENIDVKAEIMPELPNHEAVDQLVRQGVLRRVTIKDKDFLSETGFSGIDTWGNPEPNFDILRYSNCNNKKERYTNHHCNCYFLNKPLEKLPRGLEGVYGITIFVPTDMEPPVKWQNSHTTSNIMRLHATSEQLREHYKKTN